VAKTERYLVVSSKLKYNLVIDWIKHKPIIGVRKMEEVVNKSMIPISSFVRLCVNMGSTMKGVREFRRLMSVYPLKFRIKDLFLNFIVYKILII
jgi:hypothetical protein